MKTIDFIGSDYIITPGGELIALHTKNGSIVGLTEDESVRKIDLVEALGVYANNRVNPVPAVCLFASVILLVVVAFWMVVS
jgi:hypothetical protein